MFVRGPVFLNMVYNAEDEIDSALWKLLQQLFGAIKLGSAVSRRQLLC